MRRHRQGHSMPQVANRERSSHSSLRVLSRRLAKTNPRQPAMMPGDAGICDLTSGAAGGYRFRPHLTSVVAIIVPSTPAVVALDPRELLNAPTVDRLAGVEVALRVECDTVQERKLACLESRRAKPGEDRAQHAAHDVHDLVPSVNLEHERLRVIVGEREVPRGTGSAESRYAADSQRHAGTRNDRDDPLQHAGLGEDLDAVVGAIAHIHQAVVAYGNAMRMAAVARGEQAARVGRR